MGWFYCALVASIIWGFDYLIVERILKSITSVQLLFFKASATTLCIGSYIVYSCMKATNPGNFSFSISSSQSFKAVLPLLILSTVCSNMATLLTLHSISLKNATLASLVELSYPLFTAFFAYILFRQPLGHPAIYLGGLLIVTGTAIIFWYS